MQIIAFGQCFAAALQRFATIDALVLKRSSRVMPAKKITRLQNQMLKQNQFPTIPGLRGTPAGINTTSASSNALPSSLAPQCPVTVARVLMCDS
jgi:hypothetical protein